MGLNCTLCSCYHFKVLAAVQTTTQYVTSYIYFDCVDMLFVLELQMEQLSLWKYLHFTQLRFEVRHPERWNTQFWIQGVKKHLHLQATFRGSQLTYWFEWKKMKGGRGWVGGGGGGVLWASLSPPPHNSFSPLAATEGRLMREKPWYWSFICSHVIQLAYQKGQHLWKLPYTMICFNLTI